MQVLREVHETPELRLAEGVAKKPGVLAVVEGVFFVADIPSRNGRVYPRELWEQVLSSSDVKRMLKDRVLFGTVGHTDDQIDDLIREQKISHVVTDLKILSDGKGWGRAEILDTPLGRVLKTLLESGSKLAVSSKAYGEYEGQTAEGYWKVSPSGFRLERFDFVVDPGFLEAQPKLKEVYESVVRSKGSDVIGKLIEEKKSQEKRILDLMKEVEDRERKLKEVEKKLELVEGIRQGMLEREVEKIADLMVEKLGVSEEDLKSNSLLGVVRKIRKFLEKSFEKDEEVKEMEKSKLDELKERVRKKILEAREKFGDGVRADELKERIRRKLLEAERNGIKDLKERVRRKLQERINKKAEDNSESLCEAKLRLLRKRVLMLQEALERRTKLLKEAYKVVKKVEELGGIEKIEEALKRSCEVLLAAGNKIFKENVDRLVAETGEDRERVKEVLRKYGLKEARRVLSKKGEKLTEVVSVSTLSEEDGPSLARRLAEKFAVGGGVKGVVLQEEYKKINVES